MKSKRMVILAIKILLITNILLVITTISFNLNTFNEKFYKEEFEKYAIYKKFPDQDIEKINYDILSYLKNKKEDFNNQLFNEREITHLKDVKELIQKTNLILYTSLISLVLLIILLFISDKKQFIKNLSLTIFFSGLLILCVTGLLLISFQLNFDKTFTAFHNIFFPQGGWLFNPSDNLIKLYPEELFYDIAKQIFLGTLLYGNILIGAGILGYYSKRTKYS